MSSLENLVRVGQLKQESPSDDEIATSLRKAALYLADAALPSLQRKLPGACCTSKRQQGAVCLGC